MQGADKGRGIVLIVKNLQRYPSLATSKAALDRRDWLQYVSKKENKVTDYYFSLRDFDYSLEVNPIYYLCTLANN